MGIFSISPELGDDNKGASNNFYPIKDEIVSILQLFLILFLFYLFILFRTSYQPINFLINLMVFQPEVKEWKITKNKLFINLMKKNSQNIIPNEYKTLEITIFNHGMSKS